MKYYLIQSWIVFGKLVVLFFWGIIFSFLADKFTEWDAFFHTLYGYWSYPFIEYLFKK